MKRVLVTGGTGFIGATLIKKLLGKGCQVRSFDNNSRGGEDKLGTYLNDIEIVEGDIRNPDDVEAASKGIDIVYHLAFINGTRFFYEKPNLVLEVGLKGALNVMDAALKNGVGRYVFASSSEVYQQPPQVPTDEEVPLTVPSPKNPRFSYGGAKIMGELLAFHYAKDTDMETVVFRPHNIYGPNMGFEHVIPELTLRMKQLSEDFTKQDIELPIQGSGEETRAFCYVEDAADGIVLVGENGRAGEVYHVGTEDEISIKHLTELIAQELKINISLKTSETLLGSTTRRCPSINKIKGLGYSPKTSLKEGLKKTCQWYINY